MKKLLLKFTLLVVVFALPCSALAAKNILVFGDSLSAGYGIARDASWVSLLQKDLARSHPLYQVVNASVSGETTAGGRRRITQALQQHRPVIVIVELGANDGLRGSPLAEAEKNLGAIIAQSRKVHAQVLLLGMQIPPNYGLDYAAQFRALYTKLEKKYQTALVPFFLEGVTPEQFQADNLHPTAEAQPQILRNIMPALKPLLDHP
jgi:acyl-CoA thioesterase-1